MNNSEEKKVFHYKNRLPEEIIINLGICDCCGCYFGIVISGRVLQYRCYGERKGKKCKYFKSGKNCNRIVCEINDKHENLGITQRRASNAILLSWILEILLQYNHYVIIVGMVKEIGIMLQKNEKWLCMHEIKYKRDTKQSKYFFGFIEKIEEWEEMTILFLHYKDNKICEKMEEAIKYIDFDFNDYPFVREWFKEEYIQMLKNIHVEEVKENE